MALTLEEERKAEIHAQGALNVYKGLLQQAKSTEEDILQKIKAADLIVADEMKRIDAQRQMDETDRATEANRIKYAKAAHLPDERPGTVEPFADKDSFLKDKVPGKKAAVESTTKKK